MIAEERDRIKVQRYLDSLVKAARRVRTLSTSPCKLSDKSEVEIVSYFCGGVEDEFQLHIYQGLQRMAELLGIEVDEDREMYADRDEIVLSFNYNGCKVFQIGYDDEKGVE